MRILRKTRSMLSFLLSHWKLQIHNFHFLAFAKSNDKPFLEKLVKIYWLETIQFWFELFLSKNFSVLIN